MSADDRFPPSQPHGEITQVFRDIYLVTGSMRITGRLPLQFSRNMTILRQNGELILVNSVRLNETGLARLDGLGDVKHVIRLAGFHGMDDPFYKARYGATVWSVNAPYFTGVDFNIKIEDGYFQPDMRIEDSTDLPVKDSRPICINSANPKELLIYIEREGGILISGDSLQNWGKPDSFFNLPGKLIMRMMGFIKPCNIGPAWLKYANPDIQELKTILNLEFMHILPAHGTPVVTDARKKYLPAFEKL